MILDIDETTRIASDTYGWAIQVRPWTEKNGYGEWAGKWFYPTIEKCVRGLYEHRLRASEAASVDEAIADAKSICETLSHALRPIVTVSLESVRT